MQEEISTEMCKKELRRAAWKIQNQNRRSKNREIHSEYHIINRTSYTDLDSELFVKEMIEALPEKGRKIIQRIVLEGVPEMDVAKELGICQQAVNRWKKKMLLTLRTKYDLTSS